MLKRFYTFRLKLKTIVVSFIIYFIFMICLLSGVGKDPSFSENKMKELNKSQGDVTKLSQNEPLIILFWTKFFYFTDADIWTSLKQGLKSQPDCGCTHPENYFLISMNRSLYTKASAIVFHPLNTNLSDLPIQRRQDQLWVAFELEPYAKFNNTDSNLDINWKQFDGLFNWTMNFRRDSDVWAPYGTFMKNEKVIAPEDITLNKGVKLDEWIYGKSRSHLMASVISHCETQSRREVLLEIFRNLSFPMDNYGRCGDLEICGAYNNTCNDLELWMDLGRRYKFYFAAENSLCEDYISEKFWRSLTIGIVPVVYGGADYKALAPPNSFIDVDEFSSLEELVQFLLDLNNDDKRYKSYFLWRSRYHIRWDNCFGGFCSLCEKITDFKKEKWTSEISKSYENLDLHWRFIRAKNGMPKRPSCYAPVY